MDPPDAAYYLNGYLYQDTSVYTATTGMPATAYQPHLGNLPAFTPHLVNGIVYMLGRVPSTQDIGKATLFALRPTDGSVLWQWNDCGESDNMDGPVFIGSSVDLDCEVAPANWRLVSLQASTGALLWSEPVPGEPGYPLVGDQQGVYLPVQDRCSPGTRRRASSSGRGALQIRGTGSTASPSERASSLSAKGTRLPPSRPAAASRSGSTSSAEITPGSRQPSPPDGLPLRL